jgi:uncharacterized protein (TIGR03435 family)
LGVYEISGPDWLTGARFDITAKAASAVSEDQLRLMLQSLLKERFMLAVHRQVKDLSGYALVVGKNGTKLRPAEGGGEGSMTGAALVLAHIQFEKPIQQITPVLLFQRWMRSWA